MTALLAALDPFVVCFALGWALMTLRGTVKYRRELEDIDIVVIGGGVIWVLARATGYTP